VVGVVVVVVVDPFLSLSSVSMSASVEIDSTVGLFASAFSVSIETSEDSASMPG
jgi:hypothetical protein